MRIIYIADDGTEFENEWECEAYEDGLRHPDLNNIIFYDKNDSPYQISNDPFDDDIYNNCEKVLIHNEKEYEAFRWLAQECGWCEFQNQIKSPGLWMRQTDIATPFIDTPWEKIG